MKKLLYAATALAILAGCSKDLNEAPANVSATKGNTIELNLLVAPDSRAVYDGDSHIIWEDGDDMTVILGVDPTKRYGIGSGTLKYNGDNDKPLFSGKIDEIEEDDNPTGKELTVYGAYPSSAIRAAGAYEASIVLKETQNPTQEHWDGKADVMVIEPTSLTGTIETYEERGYWSTETYYRVVSEPTEIKLAHLFGFGCISFDSLPEEVLNEKVHKFSITATGENKSFTGGVVVDLRKNVFDEDFTYTDNYYTSNVITLTCDDTVALKDYKAWFVANPGQYDIKIDIVTPNYTLAFEREGLNIQRSKIASPVINYKEATDVCTSNTVDLTGGKTWVHYPDPYYRANYSSASTIFISSSKNPAVWGTLEDMPKVEYTMTFSNDPDNYPGGYDQLTLTTGERLYVQKLNGTYLKPETGNVAVKSGYQYAGVKCVKVSSGLYNYSNEGSCDISAFLVEKNGTKHQLGQAQQIVANTENINTAIYDYYFTTDLDIDGNLEIVWDNFTYGRAVLSQLAINPAPEIKAIDKLALYGDGGEGTIDVEVAVADSVTAESDAEWLTISYSDGKITYSATPYSGDELNRKANITITATGFAVATKTIAVSQLSNNFAEYSLTILPDDLTPYLEAAKAEYEAANEGSTVSNTTTLSFNATMKAVIADGSGATMDVDLYFYNVEYGSATYAGSNGMRYFKLKNSYTSTIRGYINNLSSVDKVTKFVVGNNSYSYNYNLMYLGDSADATTTKLTTTKTNDDIPYLYEGAVNASEDYGFFKLLQDTTGNNIYSVNVSFISKKPEVPGYGDHGDPITSDDGNYNW